MKIQRSTGMWRLSLASAMLAGAGCASTAQGPPDPAASGGVTSQVIRGSDYTLIVPRMYDSGTRSDELNVAAEQVWPALAATYTELGIPLNTVDEENRLVGATRARLRRIGERSIAAYFDCGGGFGNAAARYNVYVTVSTQAVTSGSASTSLRTGATANAESSTQSTEVVCNSTKALEALIAERVRQKLAPG